MNQQSQSLTQPIQFGQLMDLYEHNYILIRRLFGDLKRLKPGDECPWSAQVNARIQAAGRHTLDIHFIDQRQLDKKQRPIRLKVRVYHDARTAELLSAGRREQCLQDNTTYCIKKQFIQNSLLKSWLSDELSQLK